MAGRRHDPAAFRRGPLATPGLKPSRRQATAMITGLVLVAGTVAVASFAVKPNKAHAFDLFYGSVFLNDERAPVAVDLTNAVPTVRLVDANTQVSAKHPSDLAVVPLTNGTLLLNAATGEFNVVDPTGFVIKSKDGGVPLPKPAGATASVGIAAGASAYVVQTGPSGTSVYLVGQSTVQAATGQGAKVKPRASVSFSSPGSTAPGRAASANGQLWLLVGSGASRTVRQLSLPRGSDAGVTLDSAERATVPAVSSIGVTTGRPGGDAAAVATPEQVKVFDASGGSRTLALSGLTGVDEILPASNQKDRLSFLYHSTAGWSLVSAPVGGVGLRGPVTLRGIDPAAALVAPAASNGKLFTMDRGASGRVWQIDANGSVQTPAGAAEYPIVRNPAGKALEVADFGDAYAIGRGSRVVFNSPNHVRALAVFTDGSHPPVRIDKSAAVSLNAAGDVTALTDPHAGTKTKDPKAPPKDSGKTPAAQAVTDKVRCKNTTQVPHIPTITQATPGSRSVQLLWTYPLLDTHDCAPSTYTVSVRLISSAAPSPPSALTVQGQDGVNLTGLFPDTRYEITVTAYLNGRGTPSAPVEVTTGPEGPAAPASVHGSTDGSGNWTVSWSSCGGVAQGCVASSSWSIIPSFCDGSGLSSTPATISVAGDSTQHSFTAQFPGNDSTLGRGLNFQVEGIGTKGTVGTPGRDGGCSYSWTPPVTRNISIAASSPPATTGQATSSTTVAVSFADGQVHDLGGVGGQLTYTLISGGRVITKTGPTTAATAQLDGIRPGQPYQVSVVASPPRHPEAGVTVGPIDVTPAIADWPALSVSATFANADAFQGTLTVAIHGLTSAGARGETFDLSASRLDCIETHLDLTRENFDPAAPLTFPIARSDYNGTCSVTVHLVQNAGTATDPSIFGAGASPGATSAQLSIDPPSLTAGAGDFAAAWSASSTRDNPQVVVSYHGADPLLLSFATGWSITVFNGATPCGTSNQKPPTTVVVAKACVTTGATFTVHITLRYFLAPPPPPGYYTVAVTGTAPQPVNPTQFTFTAAWNGVSGGKPQVNIQTATTPAGDNATLASLGWSQVVSASTSRGVACGSSAATPTTATSGVNVSVTRASCPNLGGPTPTTWSVTISYSDPSGVSPDHSYRPIAVTGVEP